MLLALIVAGMTVTTSAAEGDIITEYGVVPATYKNYSFAVFHKAPGESEYSFYRATNTPFVYYSALTGDVVYLMLKSVNYSGGSTLNITPDMNARSITIDLGGNTLLAADEYDGTFHLYNAAIAKDTETFFTVKNGTVTCDAKPFIVIGKQNESSISRSLVKNITFENVTFNKYDRTPYYKQNFVKIDAYSKSEYTVNIVYNECVLDLSGVVMTDSGVGNALNSDQGTSNQTVNTEFKGGEIIVPGMNGFQLINGENVVFSEGETGYFDFVAPAGETVDFGELTFDKDTVEFVKVVDENGKTRYQATDLETEYGTISEQYASIYDYPFAVFTKTSADGEWTFKQGYADPWLGNNITHWWKSPYTAILVRRDIDFSQNANCSNCIRVNSDVVIDLNGFSIRASDVTVDGKGYSSTLFFASKSVGSNMNNGLNYRYWTFKNGSIITGAQPFIVIGHNSTMTEAPTVTINFDNVTFDRAEGATATVPFVKVDADKTAAWAFTTNINYNNCTFDMRGAMASTTTLFHVTANNPSYITSHVAVNGGKILADVDTDKLNLQSNVGYKNGSTFNVNKGSDGKYIQLVLPAGTENKFINGSSTTGSNIYQNPTDGIAYSFCKSSTDGVNDTYQFAPYWMTTSQAIPKTSITLSTDLIYNIYLPTGRVTAAKINGEVVDLGSAPKVTLDNGLEYWHITVEAGLLGAGDEIELVTTVNVGGTARLDATRKINVVKYAKNVLAANLGATTDKLVKDMLAYVKAACVYAGNKAETVAAIEGIIGKYYTVNPTVATAVASTEGLASAALLLGDRPAFVFYPELDENGDARYDLNAYKFAIGSTTIETEIDEINGKTAIVVSTFAYAMTETVTYTIEGTEISGAYNLAAYLQGVQGNTNTVALVEALYAYSLAAKAYKTEQVA